MDGTLWPLAWYKAFQRGRPYSYAAYFPNKRKSPSMLRAFFWIKSDNRIFSSVWQILFYSFP
jgi:hypothetical protein